MDDDRIKQLRSEVLSQLRGPSADLETRVTALEEAVAQLQRAGAQPATVSAVSEVHVHPSLRFLGVLSGSAEGRCCLEPEKPCVGSGQCRALGH